MHADSVTALADDDDPPPSSAFAPRACLFPPALVPVLRGRTPRGHPSLVGATDEILAELFTVVFFAGLATEEGERYAIRVAFVGPSTQDVILPEGEAPDAGPMLIYRWSTIGFGARRPFTVAEVVKLAVVSRSGRVYTKVGLVNGRLQVLGLTREGTNVDDKDPYLKLIVSEPGNLSIRSGTDHLIDYEGGDILSPSVIGVLSQGPVRRCLDAAAIAAGMPPAGVDLYIEAVRGMVREMREHGKGGILVIRNDSTLQLPEHASYETRCDPSLTSLLKNLTPSPSPRSPDLQGPNSSGSWPILGLRRMLRTAFATEVERCIADYGACTAMDGATLLDRDLRMLAFGVVLSVAREIGVAEAIDVEGKRLRPFDLSNRGARHKAAATYAQQFPGSVVFVASQDGPVACLFRDPGTEVVVLWRFGHFTSPELAAV